MQKIELSNLEDCFLMTSDKDYHTLKDFKWRYTGKGRFITHVKVNNLWTTTTVNRILYPAQWWTRYLHKDGNILNVSQSNKFLYSKIKDKEEVKQNLIDLRKIGIVHLDNIFNKKLIKKYEGKYRGVIACHEQSFYKSKNIKPNWESYFAHVIINRYQWTSQMCKTAEEAALIYNTKAQELFGDKAKLNVIGQPGKIVLASEFSKI